MAEGSTTEQRYVITTDDDGHTYVVMADHLEEFEGLEDDELNDGVFYAWQVGGHSSLVTFTSPLIDGEPLQDGE